MDFLPHTYLSALGLNTLENESWIESNVSERHLVSDLGRAFSTYTRNFVGFKSQDGYMRIVIRQRAKPLHRVIYESFNGKIEDGKIIRHLNDVRDDNRLANLEVGDHRENYYDSIRNGSKDRARITESLANRVIDLRNQGRTYHSICQELSLDRAIVDDVINKGIWTTKKVTYKAKNVRKITEKDYERIFLMRANKSPSKEIAKAFGVSDINIRQILCGLAHPKAKEKYGYLLNDK